MLYRVEPVNPSPYVKNDYYNGLDWSNSKNNPAKYTDTQKSFSDVFKEAISQNTSNENND
ncbi:hypothetical protein [Anaeromicrobium sediminis]|uniref:Uncharacterized protein n=1 Tax=Anaeromicrobium sediminis TaxID=1478221 RepID=A0A267MQC7_9FIRM|nr:hypothetical protein [Anaeromicrobium sediminis]PAB61108.1 hypothetical protein CCE28_01380 [Anaeromicrobium sediminis]